VEQNGSKKNRWTDERVEAVMGNLLRAGVILAAIVVLVEYFICFVMARVLLIIGFSVASRQTCATFQPFWLVRWICIAGD
jgi:hypothetical protein